MLDAARINRPPWRRGMEQETKDWCVGWQADQRHSAAMGFNARRGWKTSLHGVWHDGNDTNDAVVETFLYFQPHVGTFQQSCHCRHWCHVGLTPPCESPGSSVPVDRELLSVTIDNVTADARCSCLTKRVITPQTKKRHPVFGVTPANGGVAPPCDREFSGRPCWRHCWTNPRPMVF